YFGQGALLIKNPGAAHNPFYLLAPTWALYPLVVLATIATVIASQAIISGVFSLTRQAIQLGYFPRMQIVHTSTAEIGQVYIAAVVFTLMTTWRRGRQILNARLSDGALTPELFVTSLRARPPVRVPGTAVFMHRTRDAVPPALLHSLKHYKAMHHQVILLTVM